MSLHVKNIHGGYGKSIICKHISFEIQDGEVLCIVGPNGSGKTTLIKLILGLLEKKEGTIAIDSLPLENYSLSSFAKCIAYVPQQQSVTFSLTVFDMVLMGRTSYLSSFSLPKKEDEDIALHALKQLGLQHLKDEYYDSLSTGQKQMILIARSLCQMPRILIMDEPTSNLDYQNQSRIIHAIQSLSRQGFSIIVTSHNLNQPFLYAHKVLMLKNGETYAMGETSSVLTKQNLSNVYDLEMDIIKAKDSKGQTRTFCIPV